MQQTIEGKVYVLGDNIDTDQIIPAHYLMYNPSVPEERKQFGRQICKFGAIREMLADMATEIEAGRQLMLSAAAMKDRGVNFSMQASMAKLYASEMVNRVTARAVQMHGGYGFIREYPVERFYRDARVFTIYEGTSEIQRIVISNHIFQDKRTP